MQLRELLDVLNPATFPMVVAAVLLVDVSRTLRRLVSIEEREASQLARIESALRTRGGRT